MEGGDSEDDYTVYTLSLILLLTILVVYYSSVIDLISLVTSITGSFQSSSVMILIWRIFCLLVGVSAAIYMVKIGA